MKYVKQMVSAFSAALITIASAYVMDADEVMSEDVYNVQLKVETVEIDINEIPENREVRVGVSIDNNPGFLGLWFPIEWDGRLSYDWYRLYDLDFRKLCVSNTIMKSSDSFTAFSMSNFDLNSLYYENNTLVTFNFKLPEQIKVGDFFYINLLGSVKDEDMSYSCIFTQEHSFDNDHGLESFAPFINGGIKIVGQEPEPVQEPPQESESLVQPSESDIASPQPTEETQQNNNVEQQVIVETTVPVTEVTTAETATVTTSTTTVTTAPETTVSTTVSEKTTTEETTVSGTPVTEVSENSTDDEKEKKYIIPIIVAGIAVIAAVITGVIFRRKRENKDEN